MSRRAGLAVAASGLALAGCGSAQHPGQRIPGHTLTIYFGGPLHGASSPGALAALSGARLALDAAHSRIGRYRIALRVLDDSTYTSAGWDPNQTSVNARAAVQDPTAVAYLGDFNSGASAISIPLLNRAGIPQISPGSTAVGLTTSGPGAAPGEPQKYYPTGVRTFTRVVPTDARQAVALVQAQRALGCHNTFVLDDGEVDGEDAALTFVLTAQSAGLSVIAVQAFKRAALTYAPLAASVATTGADCIVISAIDERSAALLTDQLASALPAAMIFAGNGLADRAYLDPAEGGVRASLDPRLIVVSATLPARVYPREARAFFEQYASQFGSAEAPAIFGYEAMDVLLAAIDRATDGGRRQADRGAVRSALFSTRRRRSVFGPFRIDARGDTSIRSFGIYRVNSGALTFWTHVNG